MIFRISRSFALSTGLRASCRSCPVFGRDFVNAFHPRAIEKCGPDRKGEYYVAHSWHCYIVARRSKKDFH